MDRAGGFADGKEEGALRTIGEVSRALGIKPHVLRYWERHFDVLKPLKRSGGRRYYRARDVELLRRIDDLVNRQRFTLKGAADAIAAGGAEAGQLGPGERQELLRELREVRALLQEAL
jgi:DNA-binding transcriptional MerR regulator